MSASVSSSCSRLERTWAASRRNAHSDPSDWPDALISPYLSEGRRTGRNALVPARLRVATLWYVKSAASTDSTSVSTLSPKMVELVRSAAGGEGESVRVRTEKGREQDVNEDGPSTSVWSSSRSTSLDGVTRATQSCGPQILAERARSAEWRPPNEDRVDCRACKKVSVGSKRGGEARRGETWTHHVVVGHRGEDDAEERDDEVRLAQERRRLVGRAVLERDEEVLALAREERERLPGCDGRLGAERDERVDDELQSRQEELVMPLGRGRDEAVEVWTRRRPSATVQPRGAAGLGRRGDAPMDDVSATGRAPRKSHSASRPSSSAASSFSAPSRVDASRIRNDICAS